jgi:hypothetical protein
VAAYTGGRMSAANETIGAATFDPDR